MNLINNAGMTGSLVSKRWWRKS